MIFDAKSREYTIFEIIKISSDIYFANLKYILAVCTFVFLPYLIISIFVTNASASMGTTEVERYFISSLIMYPVSILFTPLAAAAITYVVFSHMAKKDITLSGILDASLMKWGKLLLAALVYYAAMILPAITVIFLPLMLYFAVSLYFYANIIAITDKKSIQALVLSLNLVRGRWFSVFSKFVVITMFDLAAVVLFSRLFDFLPYNNVSALAINFALRIITSFFQIATSVMFINYLTINQTQISVSDK